MCSVTKPRRLHEASAYCEAFQHVKLADVAVMAEATVVEESATTASPEEASTTEESATTGGYVDTTQITVELGGTDGVCELSCSALSECIADAEETCDKE